MESFDDSPRPAEAPPDPESGGGLGGADSPAHDEPGVCDLDSDQDFERLAPEALTLALIGGGISWLVLSGLLAVGALIAMLVNPLPGAWWLWPVLWVLTAGLLVVSSVLVPRWRHRRTLFRVDRRGLQIRRGLLWRSRVFVPRSRIQHTDVGQGPIERQLGLAHLTVHTAGTHNASVTLGGIHYERALAMRRELVEEGGKAADGV